MNERRYALIIANDVYSDPHLNDLVAPSTDAQTLNEVLGDDNIGSFDSTLVINASSKIAAQALENFFKNKHKDDLILVYFSGHGIKNERGKLYFAFSDTQLDLLKSTAIESTFISDLMVDCESQKQILILDSCYSGAFGKNFTPKAAQVINTSSYFDGQGRVILTASDAVQYSYEDQDSSISNNKQSVFTRILVHGLKTGNADIDKDGIVTIDELYQYIDSEIKQKNTLQEPMKWAMGIKGKIVVARNPMPITPHPVALPEELVRGLESSQIWMREGALGELKVIAQGSNQLMQLAALAAIERMRQDDSRRLSTMAEQFLKELSPSSEHYVPAEFLEPVSILDIQQDIRTGWNINENQWVVTDPFELIVPVGIYIHPETSKKETYLINFNQGAGHLAVVGGPGSGKTNFIKTLCLSLAFQYLPDQLHIYIVSYSSRNYEEISLLPHVGDVIYTNEDERLSRLWKTISNEILVRKEVIGKAGYEDIRQFNQNLENKSKIPYIFVMIDSFHKDINPDITKKLELLIQDCTHLGILFVITALQTGAFPTKLLNLIQERISFYQLNKTDIIDFLGYTPKKWFQSPRPGKALCNSLPSTFIQMANLSLKIKDSTITVGRIAREMNQAWLGSCPQKIYLLPNQISLTEITERYKSTNVIVGIEGENLSPLILNADNPDHMMIIGGNKTGKTETLTTILFALAEKIPPSDLQILLIDGVKGDIRKVSDLPHVVDWVKDPENFFDNLATLESIVKERQEFLRKQNFKPHKFPKIIVAIDDYDLNKGALGFSDTVLIKMGELCNQYKHCGLSFMLSTSSIENDYFINQMRRTASILSLENENALLDANIKFEFDFSNTRLNYQGRGLLYRNAETKLIQMAYPDAEYVEKVIAASSQLVKRTWEKRTNINVEQLTKDQKEMKPNTGSNWFEIDNDLIEEYLSLRREEKK